MPSVKSLAAPPSPSRDERFPPPDPVLPAPPTIPVKALIIDDEPFARQELRGLLETIPEIEVGGEAGNAREALALTAEIRPDLLFLDIEMPGRNGFEFLEALPPPHPHVIFTTAYDQFAIRAFEANALDYLLKPIHPQRLAASLEKLKNWRKPDGNPEAPPAPDAIAKGGTEAPLREDDRVFVRTGDRCWFVAVRSIRLLEAEDNYTRIHFGTDKPLLHRSLGAMEARLPARMFVRANRAQLINVTLVEKVSPWFSDSLKVTLAGGQEIEFSRRQAQVFRSQMSL